MLYIQLSRKDASYTDRSDPSSTVNYRYLTNPEKVKRMQRLHSLQRSTKLKNARLRKALEIAIGEKGDEVDKCVHEDLQTIMRGNQSTTVDHLPDDSFKRLFWEQQQKMLELKNAKSMRWHPLMVKWCLYLHHLSSKAYETLRSSGFIRLPSQRTLRDHTYYAKASTGFSAEVAKQLYQVANIAKGPERNKYVVIVIDEMYIKEDLVYDKRAGALIGFSNLGDINTHLFQFQSRLEKDADSTVLAKTMLVFMVRGLFSNLEFPYAQFACTDITGDLLFAPIWEAVSRLERCGLKVLALTADGASPNRRLFRIHDPTLATTPHKVPNPYATDGRDLLFFFRSTASPENCEKLFCQPNSLGKCTSLAKLP